MPPRDPNKAARNKTIEKMKEELRSVLEVALPETDRDSESSLNAFIGSKAGEFLDLKNEVIRSPEEYISKWLQGLEEGIRKGNRGSFKQMHEYLKSPNKHNFRKYCEVFLRRSFLKHYDELSKVRPRESESSYWFGLNDAHYGIFVAPRFNRKSNNWENDVSEIRAFSEAYWTIGHVLETGICLPNIERKYEFSKLDDYLNFFYFQIRLTKSPYQLAIADKYIEFVNNSSNPRKVPLLIPELRFDTINRRHIYRLDFFIVNPYTMDKIGIEFSPWSTHGKLSGKHKSLIELNSEALQNFENEIHKQKSYFRKFNIYTLIYTDQDLQDMNNVFCEISKFLNPSEPPVQLALNLIQDYFEK